MPHKTLFISNAPYATCDHMRGGGDLERHGPHTRSDHRVSIIKLKKGLLATAAVLGCMVGMAVTQASELTPTSPRYQAALEAAAAEGADALAAERRDSVTAQTGRIRVKYRESLDETSLAAMETEMTAAIESRGNFGVQAVLPGGESIQTIVLDRAVEPQVLERLASDITENAAVEWAVAEKIERAQQVNDPLFAQQWHYHDTVVAVRVEPAWQNVTGEGVTVAVLDTGILEHEDIAAQLVDGFDFVTALFRANDGDGRDADPSDPGDWCPFDEVPISSWHGLHVAGTVAAVTDNDLGVAGVARDAQILPLRVLGTCGGSSFDITDAIRWAAGASVAGVPDNANPAQVINLSLGGSGACDADYADAIAAARQRGATVVVAAGNSDADVADFRPANCEGVVVVTGTNPEGARAFFGGPGRGANFGDEVDIAAPGGETFTSQANGVLSTLNSGIRGPGLDAYEAYQGTSMATPHVAGVAALIYQAYPDVTSDEVEEILQTTSQPFPQVASRQCSPTDCGAGIIDADAAVVEAMYRASGSDVFAGEPGLSFAGMALTAPQPEILDVVDDGAAAGADHGGDTPPKSVLVLSDSRMFEQGAASTPAKDLLSVLQEVVSEAEAARLAAMGGASVAQPREEGGPDVQPQVIIGGTDSRFKVANSVLDNYPYRAIGRIGNCSGTLIGPRHVLTAAHCLHDDDGTWFWPLFFQPGFDAGDNVNGPRRRAVARRAYVGYEGNRAWDIGLMVLEDEPQTASLGRFGFWYYNNTGTYDDRTVFNFGYPIASLSCPGQTCDGHMWGMSCRLSSASNGELRHPCDTQNGHSGSPIYEIVNGGRRVLGVHWGSPGGGQNGAARIRPQVASDLCTWMSWWPSSVGTMPDCAR